MEIKERLKKETLTTLKQFAKQLKLTGYSKLKKQDFIDLIITNRSQEEITGLYCNELSQKEEKICKYKDCRRRGFNEDEYCIFHSNDIERKKEEFNDLFWEEYRRLERENESLNFAGFVFPKEIYFTFSRHARRGISFKRATFLGEVAFDDFRFHGDVTFEKATFSQFALFDSAKFEKSANFSKTKFLEVSSFNQVIFIGDTSFSETEFSKFTSFESTKFSETQRTFFDNTTFSGKALSLPTGTDFLYSTFISNIFPAEEDIQSRISNFSSSASFFSAKFLGESIFNKAKFSRDVIFHRTKFLEKASFKGTKFLKLALFEETDFQKIATFYDAVFSGSTSFDHATFSGYTEFNKGIFLERVSFSKTEFMGESHFEAVTFDDISKITMNETYFHDVYHLLKILKSKKNKKKRKNELKKNGTEFLCENIKINLGEDCIASHPIIARQIKDDRFLMEFKKEHPKRHWIWWFFSDCGRSFTRWALFSLFFVSLFALIYIPAPDFFPDWWINLCNEIGPQFQQTADAYKGEPLGLWSCFYFSIVTFTTLGFGDVVTANTTARILVSLEVILGYIMLGGLISILANKIARRS